MRTTLTGFILRLCRGLTLNISALHRTGKRGKRERATFPLRISLLNSRARANQVHFRCLSKTGNATKVAFVTSRASRIGWLLTFDLT